MPRTNSSDYERKLGTLTQTLLAHWMAILAWAITHYGPGTCGLNSEPQDRFGFDGLAPTESTAGSIRPRIDGSKNRSRSGCRFSGTTPRRCSQQGAHRCRRLGEKYPRSLLRSSVVPAERYSQRGRRSRSGRDFANAPTGPLLYAAPAPDVSDAVQGHDAAGQP